MHPAIQLCIRRHGRVVLNRAIGHGWGNAPTDSARRREDPRHHGHAVLRVLGGQGHHRDRRAHARRARRLLARRPRLRLHPQLHQPRQGSHHHPARDDPQRRPALPHRAQAGRRTRRRPRVRPAAARRAAAAVPAGVGAHLPRADLGSADARNRLRGHRQRHSRNPGHRDPRPARLPVDQLRRRQAGRPPGRAQPRHRTPVAAGDRRDLPQGDRRNRARDHPVHQHPGVPDHRDPVVEHRVDGERAVALRRNLAARRRTRRRAGHEPGNGCTARCRNAAGCGRISRWA